MTSGSKIIFAAVLSATLTQLPAQTNTNANFANDRDKASYAIGVNVGGLVKQRGLDVNMDQLVEGLKDGIAGNESKMNPQEVGAVIMAYQQQAMTRLTEENKKKGQEFLAANKTKPGVQVRPISMPDGSTAELQYKIIKEGDGPAPGSNDMVTVEYRGTLLDGKEFDSSTKRGKPATFPVNGVIRGWSEALKQMKVGSKWELYIPAALAYGDRGNGAIPPASTLIFEVELLKSEAPKPPPMPAPTSRSGQPMTSDIVRVPSADEMKKGAKIEVIKAEDAERIAAEMSKTNKANGSTNK